MPFKPVLELHNELKIHRSGLGYTQDFKNTLQTFPGKIFEINYHHDTSQVGENVPKDEQWTNIIFGRGPIFFPFNQLSITEMKEKNQYIDLNAL